MGAYFQLLTPGIPELGGWVYMGPYDTQAYWYEFTGVMTNMTPDGRGSRGRPARGHVRRSNARSTRSRDTSARTRPRSDGSASRRSHAEAKPSLMGLQIDSADYLPAFERALELADYDQYRKEQAARRESGDVKQIGIGLSSYIEMSGLAPSNILGALRYAAGGWEAAQVRCQPSGKVTLYIGTSPHGQGHDTTWSQIAADELGVHPDDIEVLHGDTSITPLGHGHLRLALDLDRRRGAARRAAEDQGQGANAGGARARGVGGRPRVRGRGVPRAGRARQGPDDPRPRRLGVDGARPARRVRARPHRDRHLGPEELHVAVRDPRVRRRGRHRNRRDRAAPVRGRRRLRGRDQPDDRRRAGARWRRVRDRRGPVRGGACTTKPATWSRGR